MASSGIFRNKTVYTYLRVKVGLRPIHIIISSFIVAYLLWYLFLERNYIFWVGAIACNMVFFAAGDLMRKKQYGTIPTVLSLIVVITLACLNINYLSWRTNGGWQEYSVTSYILSYIISLASIILVNNLIRLIPRKMMANSFVTRIGQQSMSWFLLHHLILTWCVFICEAFGFDKTVSWTPLVAIAAIFLIIPPTERLILRYAPWMLGAKSSRDPLP